MLVCPVCETKAKKENQEYCLNCAWEFEYFFDELNDEDQKRYKDKFRIHKFMYKKSINKKIVNDLNTYTLRCNMEMILFIIIFFISFFIILISYN